MLKAFVVVALIAAFVLFASMVGMIVFSSEEFSRDDQKQPAVTEHSNSENGRAAANEDAAQHATEGKKKREWHHIFTDHLTDWLLVLFNGLLVAATIGLFVSGERNVDAARRAADAAKAAVELADRTAERQLRAYIGIHGMETTVYPFEKGGYAFISHAELRNYGQTPAYDLTVKSNVKIDILENVPFDDLPGTERGVPSIAFRDVGFHINIGWPISDEDKIALYERKKVFFFWGTVEYRDAFEKRHHFTFRLVSGQIATGTGGVYTMGPYGTGYDAD